MWNVEDHKDKRTVKDSLFTFEVGHNLIHRILVKVRKGHIFKARLPARSL